MPAGPPPEPRRAPPRRRQAPPPASFGGSAPPRRRSARHFRRDDPARSACGRGEWARRGPCARSRGRGTAGPGREAGSRPGSARRSPPELLSFPGLRVRAVEGPGPPLALPGRLPRALPRRFLRARRRAGSRPGRTYADAARPAESRIPRWGGSAGRAVNTWANRATSAGGRCQEDEERALEEGSAEQRSAQRSAGEGTASAKKDAGSTGLASGQGPAWRAPGQWRENEVADTGRGQMV